MLIVDADENERTAVGRGDPRMGFERSVGRVVRERAGDCREDVAVVEVGAGTASSE